MELSGIPLENFPPILGNDSKTLRKLSLLEARMVGAGNESRDGSLPPNDGSRGSDNNSNSMSTIGFAHARSSAPSPSQTGAGGASRAPGQSGETRSKDNLHAEDAGSGKRKAALTGKHSPPRRAPHSPNPGTPSTLSTSPGDSRHLPDGRHSVHGASGAQDGPGLKRARTEHAQQRRGASPSAPPPPQPSRLSMSQGRPEDQQALDGAGQGAASPAGAAAAKVAARNHSRRGRNGGTEGAGSPHVLNASSAKAGARLPCDRPGASREHVRESTHGARPRSWDAVARGGDALPPPPPRVSGAGQGGELSPTADARTGRDSGQHHPGHGSMTTKNIQSYFYRPSNGGTSSAVQNLASSYSAGDIVGQSHSPARVDLSGADGESLQGQASGGDAQSLARAGRSHSAGGLGGAGSTNVGRRLLQRVPSLTDERGLAHSPEASHRRGTKRGSHTGNGGAAGGAAALGTDDHQAHRSEQERSRESLSASLKDAEARLGRLRKELDRANLERASAESMAETLQQQLDRKMEEFKTKETEREEQKAMLTSVVETLLRKVSAQEASDCRAKLARDTLEIGKIVSVKTGHIGKYAEAFEEGASFKRVESKVAEMVQRRGRLEARKRAVVRLLKATTPAAGEEPSGGAARLEAVEEEESVRMHLAALKREEAALQEEKRALDARKVLHIRELKRVAHEDQSKFSRRPTLSGRYVLLNLLGKGGFSEVWRAFDLVDGEDVAVKVHQLLNNWTEPQKANFIRHVTREYEIHQQMRHPRIVNLTDVFEICCDSFATVLDYCRGTDLECLLRERKQLPERDARALILQVARGLQYLNTAQGEGANGRGAIIHYDLKPGNILLDENGDVKITDFGLSKILEIKKDTERGIAGGTSMELTSKGAGTYWYLPPECFGDNPRISSKVDVWSLGVVFYQMLYGVRPFGEGLSQEKILREKVIVNANRVEFPSKPVVSEDAKWFIRSCLTYSHTTRPDVHAMCNLPYLTSPSAKRGS